MTDSPSSKITAAKFGIATAVALGSLPMVSGEALAAVAPTSDTLQVGTQTVTLFEGSEGVPATVNTSFTQSGTAITGTQTIALTEPGSSNISDLVTATIFVCEGTGTPGTFDCPLRVTLTSDAEASLTTTLTIGESIPETGTPQNLTSDFNRLFGLTTLPTIIVTSDVEAVPEPLRLRSSVPVWPGLPSPAAARPRPNLVSR